MKGQGLLKRREYCLFDRFPADKVICAVSRRRQGNMSYVYGQTQDAPNNRKDFLGDLGIDYKDLVCAGQVHGSSVSYVTAESKGSGALTHISALTGCDALITDIKIIPISIFTADCLSIFLYDPQRPALGLVHAGWRGTKERIVAKTLQAMSENFHTCARDLLVGFGPAIRSCCYVVGREFNGLFSDGVTVRGEDYYFDLALVNSRQLLDAGVYSGNIFDCQFCTSCCHEDFFSYRKERDSSGRMISVAMLL
jgi:YfiH family protein